MYNYSIVFVVLMGMGTVFFGLVGLIILTTLVSRIVREKEKPEETAPPVLPAAPAEPVPKENGIQLAARVFVVLADELHIDLKDTRLTIEKV